MDARRFAPLLAFLVFFSLTACGGGDAPTGPGGPAPTPANPDRDGDGILNSVDTCPDQAEVVNGWGDTDGCPDDTLDFYFAVRVDVEDAWEREVFQPLGLTYIPITEFTPYVNSVGTPCGTVGSNNAFYCSLNGGVYFHRPFVDGFMLDIGDAAGALVVAHEISHHIQNLDGIFLARQLGLVTTKQMELQADCYSGAYAASAVSRGLVEEGDIEEAVNLLLEIGDDNQGFPWFNPDGHGTSAQRAAAFLAGIIGGLITCYDITRFPAADVEDARLDIVE